MISFIIYISVRALCAPRDHSRPVFTEPQILTVLSVCPGKSSLGPMSRGFHQRRSARSPVKQCSIEPGSMHSGKLVSVSKTKRYKCLPLSKSTVCLSKGCKSGCLKSTRLGVFRIFQGGGVQTLHGQIIGLNIRFSKLKKLYCCLR